MKYLFRFFILNVIVYGLVSFLGISVFSQEKEINKLPASCVKDKVEVSIIAHSDEIELNRNNSISVVIRIYNFSNEKIELVKRPEINVEKVDTSEKDKKKLIFGIRFTGNINSDSSQSKKRYLDKGEYEEFVVDLSEIKLTDIMSSVGFKNNIFEALSKGEYYLYADVAVDISKDGEKKIEHLFSNKIIIKKH